MTQLEFENILDKALGHIRLILLDRHSTYGDSFHEPEGIFSNASALERLNIQLDNKITRIKEQTRLAVVHEDSPDDLIGWLIIRKIEKMLTEVK
jgi:hypothetical protein